LLVSSLDILYKMMYSCSNVKKCPVASVTS
jgi:hypothetical protein